MKKKMCAIIPSAGHGKRLGNNMPKILIPITEEGKTVWNILYEKLHRAVDHIHVVLSPAGLLMFRKQTVPAGVSAGVQKIPVGMGDAIFGAFDCWKDYENILVVWGDQVFVSAETIKNTVTAQISADSPNLTIPVNFVEHPYVQYMFQDDFSRLAEVKQTREGETCGENGYADVGVFCLSVSNLKNLWQSFIKITPKGKKTEEINFLPFLPYLSTKARWGLKTVMVKNPVESRGINTPEDVTFFKSLFAKRRT